MLRRTLPWLVAIAAICALIAILLWMGRDLICTCGYVKLWQGETSSAENSKHLLDWFTWTHVIHGLLLYAALWLVARRLPLDWRFAIAVVFESAWEVLENSNWVIDRYRSVTVSLNYNGDSVVNSVSDVGAMMLGFWLARLLPVRMSIALVVVIEIVLALVIRDNLTLNVLMLVFPVDAVLRWQSGG
jgi:hypothetical protein